MRITIKVFFSVLVCFFFYLNYPNANSFFYFICYYYFFYLCKTIQHTSLAYFVSGTIEQFLIYPSTINYLNNSLQFLPHSLLQNANHELFKRWAILCISYCLIECFFLFSFYLFYLSWQTMTFIWGISQVHLIKIMQKKIYMYIQLTSHYAKKNHAVLQQLLQFHCTWMMEWHAELWIQRLFVRWIALNRHSNANVELNRASSRWSWTMSIKFRH